jgi:hypothetical protein
MSRRKPKPPPAGPDTARSYTIKVACSGRGQHPRIVLHHIADYRGRGMDFGELLFLGGRNGPPVSPWREDGITHYRFRCPRCEIDRPLREETLFRYLDAVIAGGPAGGHPPLDLSALP